MNSILKGIREAGKHALLNPDGVDAEYILARGTSPGITMTSGGHFVEGVVDYRYYVSIRSFVESCDISCTVSRKRLAERKWQTTSRVS